MSTPRRAEHHHAVSPPTTLTVPGAGHATITRVADAAGTEHADIALSIVLPDDDKQAEQRITALLTHLVALIGPPRTEHRPHRRDAA